MTAADRREELEAAIWRAFRHLRHPCTNPPRCVEEILDAADTYASAATADHAGFDSLLGPKRLAEASAERSGRTA